MLPEEKQARARSRMSSRTLMLGVANLIAWSIVLHLYILARFDFNWLSGDAAIFTKIIQGVQQAGQIQGGINYPYGFGYQVLAVFWSATTSITVVNLQIFIFPVAGVLPTLLAYVLFARFLSDRRAALVGAYLFGIQSDVLFTTYRSTHEKFTWTLMIVVLLLFLLAVGETAARKPLASIFGVTLAMYASLLSLFSLNLFFSNTFLLILIIGLVVGWLTRNRMDPRWMRRLAYVCTLGMVLFFGFIIYVYDPAAEYLRGLGSYGRIILTALFSLESQTTPQYQYVVASWPSIYVWLALTAATWLILGVASYTLILHVLSRRKRSAEPRFRFLNYLFLAAVLVTAGGIVADRFGGYSSNLELRLVPVMMIFATPLAGHEIARWSRQRTRVPARTKMICVAMVLVLLTPLSVAKASLEPTVTTVRSYVTPGERAALTWILQAEFTSPIWTDPSGRMLSEAHFLAPLSDYPNYTAELRGASNSSFYLVSELSLSSYPDEVAAIRQSTDSIIYTDGDALVGMHG